MRQNDTGQTMEEIRESDTNVDKTADVDYEKHYNKFMNLYKGEVAKLSRNKKAEFRETLHDLKSGEKIKKYYYRKQ